MVEEEDCSQLRSNRESYGLLVASAVLFETVLLFYLNRSVPLWSSPEKALAIDLAGYFAFALLIPLPFSSIFRLKSSPGLGKRKRNPISQVAAMFMTVLFFYIQPPFNGNLFNSGPAFWDNVTMSAIVAGLVALYAFTSFYWILGLHSGRRTSSTNRDSSWKFLSCFGALMIGAALVSVSVALPYIYVEHIEPQGYGVDNLFPGSYQAYPLNAEVPGTIYGNITSTNGVAVYVITSQVWGTLTSSTGFNASNNVTQVSSILSDNIYNSGWSKTVSFNLTVKAGKYWIVSYNGEENVTTSNVRIQDLTFHYH